jgi:hypothetical protein
MDFVCEIKKAVEAVLQRYGGRPKAVPANESCCGNVSGTDQLQ